MTTLTCDIPEKLDSQLAEVARRARLPKARFVRRALEQAVRQPAVTGPAFDIVKDLCGSLSGPSDLATNPRHLEGLGG